MDQHSTIFDKAFEAEIPPRRLDIMPKWLKIYTLCIMGLGICLFIFIAFIMQDSTPDDLQATDPATAVSYKVGHTIGTYLPAILVFMMGLTVWLERRRAILFNLIVALIWGFIIMIAVLAIGLTGLSVGILCMFFVPYWIGLFQIKRKWETEAIRGKGLL